jgi:AcrR family transcriptional regulator
LARKGEASRARILEEAHAQILSGGIASLSHERIARAAGLSKSAVYWHFPTKKALLEALVAEYVAHLRSEEARFEAPYLAMGFTDGEAILPGMRDWYRSFAQNRRGWIGIGAEILSLGRTERTLTEPVRAWYPRDLRAPRQNGPRRTQGAGRDDGLRRLFQRRQALGVGLRCEARRARAEPNPQGGFRRPPRPAQKNSV